MTQHDLINKPLYSFYTQVREPQKDLKALGYFAEKLALTSPENN